jgi:hypothetical protein
MPVRGGATGQKFHDQDADGAKSAGEQVLPRTVVYHDTNNSGDLDEQTSVWRRDFADVLSNLALNSTRRFIGPIPGPSRTRRPSSTT